MSVGDEPRPIKNVGEPRPYGSNLINCFRQGSAAEPDESPAYQNPFGESENEADQYSPGEPSSGPPIALGPGKGKLYMWKDPYVNPALQQQGQQSSMARATPKQRKIQCPKATAKTKAKTNAKKAKAKAKTKAKTAQAKPKSKAMQSKKPGKAKGEKCKKEEAMFKMWKKCQGAKVMRQHKN